MLSFQIYIYIEFTGPYLPEAKMAANNACFLRGFVTKCRSGKERMDGINGAILCYIERPTNLGFFISII